jgi:hypothetical protein
MQMSALGLASITFLYAAIISIAGIIVIWGGVAALAVHSGVSFFST